MLYRFFKSSSPVLVIALPIITIVLWLKTFYFPQQTQYYFFEESMPLFNLLTNYLKHYKILSIIITLLLLLIQGFYISHLNEKYIILPGRTYLPVFFFLIINSSFRSLQQFNPAIIASFFMLLAINKILDSYKKDKLAYQYFEAALLLSVGSLFYANMLWLVVYLWISLLLIRPGYWREYVFTITGFLAPYIILFGYHFVFNNDASQLFNHILQALTKNQNRYFTITGINKTFIFFYLWLLASGILFLLRFLQLEKVQTRNFFQLFIWLTIILIAIFLFAPAVQLEISIILSIPACFILSFYFKDLKPRWLGEIYFAFLFLFLIIAQL